MKTAVVLFNLGGPDAPEAVKPFLFNLFYDPAILRVPAFVRYFLARLISGRRAPIAREIYAQMGGRSPILPETEAQARALQAVLGEKFRVFICMRYWHPMSAEVARDVADYAPDRVILLPLYPQFSTATTASSFTDWSRAAKKAGINAKTTAVCCYPDQPEFIAAHAKMLGEAIEKASEKGKVRVLFSAHGLPEKVIKAGDPYAWQVERTVAAITRALDMPGLETVVCYQSRVGPLKWIGPATDEEITRAAREKRSLVIVPVAFVSEHSETLVELDIEYAHLAQANGAAGYFRVPALAVQEKFIEALAILCDQAASLGGAVRSGGENAYCKKYMPACPCRRKREGFSEGYAFTENSSLHDICDIADGGED